MAWKYLSVAVCDDCKEHRNALADMLIRYAERNGIRLYLETYENGIRLLKNFKPLRWKIIFLDIYMEPLDGEQTARLIRKKDRDVKIIFATASRNHALAGFELGVSDYLVKPFGQPEVDSALAWLMEEEEKALIHVRSERECLSIPLRDIFYVEKYAHSAEIHLEKQVISVRMTMQELENAMRGNYFYRCHRSYIVNFSHVDTINGMDFIMEGGGAVPIPSHRLRKAKQIFHNWKMSGNLYTEAGMNPVRHDKSMDGWKYATGFTVSENRP